MDKEIERFDFWARAQHLKQPSAAMWLQPTELDMNNPDGRRGAKQLFDEEGVQRLHDPQYADDLFEMLHPNDKHDSNKREQFISSIAEQAEQFGRWFYFPWNRTLAHFPDKEEYQALRTFRNRNMLLASEQQQLLGASMMVAGLSIGSNVVDALLHNGIGGHYVLADFDTFSATNLNRVDATALDIGESKLVVQAQKISQLDPYIKQTHLAHGVTHDSLDSLEQVPDIIFDEVDDFAAKALLRHYARQHRIAVVMATDVGDKVVVDIERYDVEQPKLFNGRIPEETVRAMMGRTLSPREKMHLTTKLIGPLNASARLLDSAMDISLAGFPQLKTTAEIAGASAALIARDILLNKNVSSGRHIVDVRKSLGLRPQSSLAEGIRIARKFIASQHQ